MYEKFEQLVLYLQMYLAYKLKQSRLNFPPIQVGIEPTNICNFKCSFCNQSTPDHFRKRRAGMMDLRDYEVILNKIKKYCKNIKILSLSIDGEPTLHNNLPELIDKANRMGVFIRFSSNGSRIDRTFLERTKNLSYLISIDFSFDKGCFEKYRGGNGSWSLVNQNLKEMINCLNTNKNLYLEIFENSAYAVGSDKARSNLKSMIEHFGKSPRLLYGLRSYHKIIDGNALVSSKNKYYGCFYPWISLVVAWNGDVVTCCRDLDGEYILGNILQSSIEEVWNGQKYLHLREAILNQDLETIPSCRSCDLLYDNQRNKWKYIIQKVLKLW